MPDLPVPRRGVDVEAVASSSTYRELVDRLKQRIRESQARAARALNTELVMLYWSIGRDILAQQQAAGWGDDIVGRIAEDLRVETRGPTSPSCTSGTQPEPPRTGGQCDSCRGRSPWGCTSARAQP